MTEQKAITKSAIVVSAATSCSRVLGFIRDAVIAWLFGAGMATDAFFVAFRLPNLFRRLLGEGALTASFIPVYTDYLTQKDKAETSSFINAVVTLILIILIIFTLAGIVFAPYLVKLIAYGFQNEPDKFALTVKLTRIMFPYIFFVGLVALAMGILNSLKHFFAPAFAPVFLNVGIIASALLLGKYFDEPVFSLAIGVLTGGLAQLVLQFPFLYRRGIRYSVSFDFSHPGLKQVVLLLIPSVFGLAVYQINVLINTQFASYLPQGSVSYLYYADRLIELPMGVFAIAIATAVLPSFSKFSSENNMDGLKETLVFSLRLTLFVTIPAMVALIVLSKPVISVLFQRGVFNYDSTIKTSYALIAYSTGLAGFAGVRIVAPVFYSLKDTKTPVYVAFFAMLVNVSLNIALMGPLKHAGLALATSVSSYFNLFILVYFLRKKIGRFQLKSIFSATFKYFSASAIMAVLIYFLSVFADWSKGGTEKSNIILLFLTVIAGVVVYIFLCRLFKVKEIEFFAEIVKRRFKR